MTNMFKISDENQTGNFLFKSTFNQSTMGSVWMEFICTYPCYRIVEILTNLKSQCNSGLFCKFCTSRACIHQMLFKTIMPNYLSIAWNISFNRQSPELGGRTNFYRGRVSVKNEMHGNLPVFGM